MIAGGTIEGCSKEITLFKADVNGDGIEDELVKQLCGDKSFYTLKLGGKIWDVPVAIDKNGGYRWTLEYSPEKAQYRFVNPSKQLDLRQPISSVFLDIYMSRIGEKCQRLRNRW